MPLHFSPLLLAFLALTGVTLAGCGSTADRTAPTRSSAAAGSTSSGNPAEARGRIDQICDEVSRALYALTQRAGETSVVLERAAEYERREVRAFDVLQLPSSLAAQYRRLRAALLRRSALRLRLARELRADRPRVATLELTNAATRVARTAAARMQLERCPSF